MSEPRSLASRLTRRLRREERRLSLRLRGPAPVERPIFLVGTVRGGTTLLAELLGAHPGVVHLGFELSDLWSRDVGVAIACPDTDDPHCPALGAADATTARRAAARHALGRRAALAGGRGRRVLNKNPHFCNKLPFLHALFPDAALVVVGRDVRSTVASTIAMWRRLEEGYGIRHLLPAEATACWSCSPPAAADLVAAERSFPGGDAAVVAEYWLRSYRAVDAALELFPRRAVVRQRDLVADPGGTLGRTLAALGLDPPSVAVDRHLDADRNERWRQILTPAEQASLEGWVERHRDDVLGLRSADTTL